MATSRKAFRNSASSSCCFLTASMSPIAAICSRSALASASAFSLASLTSFHWSDLDG